MQKRLTKLLVLDGLIVVLVLVQNVIRTAGKGCCWPREQFVWYAVPVLALLWCIAALLAKRAHIRLGFWVVAIGTGVSILLAIAAQLPEFV